MSDSQKLEQNKPEETTTVFSRALITGFVGGVIWSTFGVINYYFNFSEVAPRSFILRSWLRADWTDSWLGDVVSVLVIGLLSILVALLYYIVLRKQKSMWLGVVYGGVLWAIVYYILQPVFPNIPNVVDLSIHTIVSSICLYVLYGTFIGYSISYDYHDTKVKGDKKKNNIQQKASN